MQSAKIISISLPPEMNKEIQAVAKEEHRSMSELFREAMRQYMRNRVLSQSRRHGSRAAGRKKIKPSDIPAIIASGRR
jgi:CopG family transcriptional regulator / antitoxin EndoAI